MVFNATFNNISVISWQSILFVEEIGVPGENHRHYNIIHKNEYEHQDLKNNLFLKEENAIYMSHYNNNRSICKLQQTLLPFTTSTVLLMISYYYLFT